MPEKCPAEMYSSIKVIVRHVFFWISETIPENMPDDRQTFFFLDHHMRKAVQGVFVVLQSRDKDEHLNKL